MEITNKTSRPLSVPLPGGKKLFLGPGKSGQINAKSVDHPPLRKLIEAGDLEVDQNSPKKGAAPGDAASGVTGNQGSGPTGNIRRTGDR
jgi:hypothetical protein